MTRKVLADQIWQFQQSAEWLEVRAKMNRFSRGLACWVCRKSIGSPQEFGGGKPGGYHPTMTLRAAKKSMVRGWRHFHWLCLGKDRDRRVLEKVMSVRKNSHRRYAELFCGKIDGFPLRITMYKRRRWLLSIDFGECVVPAGKGRNLMVGFSFSPAQWAAFVRQVGCLPKHDKSSGIRCCPNGGMAITKAARGYFVQAVQSSDFRRGQFLEELDVDPKLHGPQLHHMQ